MIHTNELTKLDYQILQFVSDHGTALEKEIINKFSSNVDATKLRIDLLSAPDQMNKFPYHVISNTSYLRKIRIETETTPSGDTVYKYTGEIKLTPLGEKSLQDYADSKKVENHKYWVNSVLTPLVVAVLAAIATVLVTKYLSQCL